MGFYYSVWLGSSWGFFFTECVFFIVYGFVWLAILLFICLVFWRYRYVRFKALRVEVGSRERVEYVLWVDLVSFCSFV